MNAGRSIQRIICGVLLTLQSIVCSSGQGGQEDWRPVVPTAGFPAHLGPAPDAFLNIVHINDIYDVRQSPRCLQKINAMRDEKTLLLFSGDFMGPSVISDIDKGAQMHPVLAAFDFTFSVLGNHEFDYEEKKFLEVNDRIEEGWKWGPKTAEKVYKTKNKWLLTNFKRKKPTAVGGKEANLIPGNAVEWAATEAHGFKVCAIGLVDRAWFDATKLVQDDYVLEDPIAAARTWSKKLRTEQKCDLIFVISHMENKSDEEVIGDKGDAVKGVEPNDVDFVFGGHDHLYYMRRTGERVLLKSGMDFEQFSSVKMWWGNKLEKTVVPGTDKDFAYTYNMDENARDLEFLFSLHRPHRKGDAKYLNVLVTRVNVEPTDPKHQDLSDYVTQVIDPKIRTHLLPIIHLQSKLDTREKVMFAGESAVLNLFADAGRAYFGGDLAIVNVRMLKGEKLFFANTFLRRLDFMRLFPYRSDKYQEIEATGAEILQLLDDAVKFIHKDDKRWIGVSGVSFNYAFEGSGHGQAVLDKESVRVNSEVLVRDKKYRVVTLNCMVDSDKVGFKSILRKSSSTREDDKIVPIDLFDFVSNLFSEQRDERTKEFEFFKKKSCAGMTLDRLAPIAATNPDKTVKLLTDLESASLKQKEAPTGNVGTMVKSIEDTLCFSLLANANTDILRRLRFYALAKGLQTPDKRTVLSIDPVSKGRMVPRKLVGTPII